jgi:hypothetical protein
LYFNVVLTQYCLQTHLLYSCPTMSSKQSPTFTYFRKFPPEIQLEILKQCSRNDIVCFSLTSHDFRALTKPLITSKPHLEWVDQLGSTADIPDACPGDRGGCDGIRDKELKYDARMHRYKRHNTGVPYPKCYSCMFYPKDHPACKVAYCKKHCMCISCPLFVRLRGWMAERRYCSTCRMFTARNKKNKGRCMYTATASHVATNASQVHMEYQRYARHQTTTGHIKRGYRMDVVGGGNGVPVILIMRRIHRMRVGDSMPELYE